MAVSLLRPYIILKNGIDLNQGNDPIVTAEGAADKIDELEADETITAGEAAELRAQLAQ
jgi:hypothetical protein